MGYATIIATSGQRVTYTSNDATRSQSRLSFHQQPDGADIFELSNGQYVYMSNSERNIPLLGGVYGVIFDATHKIVDYRNYIRRTTRNCNGGRTPWNTWITCEEAYLPLRGHCWQIDPTQQRRSQKIAMSGFWGGTYEAFDMMIEMSVLPVVVQHHHFILPKMPVMVPYVDIVHHQILPWDGICYINAMVSLII